MAYSLIEELVYSDWAGSGALRLEPGCSAAELAGARFLRAALLLLETARDEGALPATRGGRLTRRCVRQLLARMPALDDLADPAGVRDEDDLFPLHIPRVVLGLAGLLVRRKGFRITRRGRALLAPPRIGELFAALFRTHFIRLDLSYLDRGPEQPHFQGTVTYSLFQVGRQSADWITAEALAELALLPDAHAWADPSCGPHTGVWLLTRLLGPLHEFGLVETRELASRRGWRAAAEYRKTPLFDRFVRFDFGGASADDVPLPAAQAPPTPPTGWVGSAEASRPWGPAGPRDFRVPLTARERDNLLRIGIEDPDLARRVRLPPLVDGWATIALNREELERVGWISCCGEGPRGDELLDELRPFRKRLSEILRAARSL